jgi:uncharacterized damage-inducible protein DinB
MPEGSGAIAPFYSGWRHYQELLVAALGPLNDAQLALGAAPTLRPIWLLTSHIIAARVWWFHRVLGEGSSNLAPLQAWDDDGQPPRSAGELVSGLDVTWRVIEDCLARWTPAELDANFSRPRPHPRADELLTRRWILWHILEHDLHHGGEVSLTPGIHGLPAPDL